MGALGTEDGGPLQEIFRRQNEHRSDGEGEGRGKHQSGFSPSSKMGRGTTPSGTLKMSGLVGELMMDFGVGWLSCASKMPNIEGYWM